MTVYWDGYGVGPRASGVGVYARRLAAELSRTAKPTLLSSEASNHWPERSIHVPTHWFFDRAKPRWPELAFRAALADHSTSEPFIYHGLSNFNLPRRGKTSAARFVLTIHDLIPFLHPSNCSQSLVWQLRWLQPRAVEGADAIVCVSRWSESCVLEAYPHAGSKTLVIENGIDSYEDLWRVPVDSETIRTLTISRFETYKRFDRLIALGRLGAGRLNMSVVTDLAGAKYLHRAGEDLRSRGLLQVHTGLSNAELSAQYQSADLYLHPSEYEGYCLPAAEALARALPVIYQSGSGIDEVVGQGVGIGLADGASADEWLDALERGVSLARRDSYQQTLRQHIKSKKSWKEAANSLESLYERLLER